MDTMISLTLWGDNGHQEIAKSEKYIYAMEDTFSTTRTTSEVYALNQNTDQWQAISPELATVLSEFLEVAQLTQGCIDPSILPLIEAWGFTQEVKQVPTEEEIQALLPYINYEAILLDMDKLEVFIPQGMALDFGAVTKGYVSDQLALEYESQGFKSAMISLGGNIFAMGKKTDGSLWNIGIQYPYGGGAIASVQVENKAVVTSGGYQRYFTDETGENHWHILDPHSGYPAKTGIASVTVISDSGFYADCLSTALFVMGLDQAISFWQTAQDFDVVIICDQGEVWVSSGLQFSVAEGYTVHQIAHE